MLTEPSISITRKSYRNVIQLVYCVIDSMENMVGIADAAATVAAVTATTERFSPSYRFSHAGFSLFVHKFNGQH